MDVQPTSDQPKTSTSIMLIWILTGVILVVAAFFVVPHANTRTGLNAAGAVAGLYLLALLVYIIRKPLRWLPRLSVIVIGILVVGATAVSWVQTVSEAASLKASTRVRHDITTRDMLKSGFARHLLPILEEYYATPGKKGRSLRSIFVTQFDSVAPGKALHPPRTEFLQPDSFVFDVFTVYPQVLKADSIVLVAVDSRLRGRNPDFKNINSRSGAIQEKAVLTPMGLMHESEN